MTSQNVLPNLALKNNIFKIYLIQFARWFLVAMPIIIEFYKSNGLSIRDVMLLQAFYSIVIVALEIPSGYVGDVLGRRKSLIIGTCFVFLGFFCTSPNYRYTIQ